MRILLDPGVHDLRNTGMNAMLQVAVDRLRELWPNTLIEVVTASPHLLKLYCPTSYPVSLDGRRDWLKHRQRLDNFHRFMPRPLLRLLLELREEVWRRWPALTPYQIRQRTRSWLRARRKDQKAPIDTSQSEGKEAGKPALWEEIGRADLFIILGGQHFSDDMKYLIALPVLDRIEAAAQLGKPVAMVGQGIGPLEDPQLKARASAVLPLVSLIAVRERKFAPSLLYSFGVEPARVLFTGDDAIELAYKARTPTMGTGVGISMRVALYAGVDNYHIEMVRAIVGQAAAEYRARLIPLPISHGSHEWDGRVIGQLIGKRNRTLNCWQRFETPLEIIHRTGRCRIVVSGTYHAAVFALAQGIPVVALAKSSIYSHKFLALADAFGGGCEVVILDDSDVQDKLMAAINAAWRSAEQVRPRLLEATIRQIELGRAAYRSLSELVESKNRSPQRTRKSVVEATKGFAEANGE